MQLPFAGMLGVQLLVCENGPVTATLDTVSGVLWKLEMVTDCVALDVPSVSRPNNRLVADCVTFEPIPVTLITCVIAFLSSV